MEEWKKLNDLEERLKTMPAGDQAAKTKMVVERVRNALMEIEVLKEAEGNERPIQRRVGYIEYQYSLIKQ